ncbi:MAG TPA: 5-formyltetrahydrofolate cyclo-ligase [Chitinophagaceae bacterium]|nr:5-formyltetrahydrofolate cyclo-ligase [Chitinophagaceae bacterium]
MLKSEARKLYRKKRQALTAADRARLDDLLLIQFQTLRLPMVHTILAYQAMESHNEPPTDSLVGFLEFRNPALHVCYPRTDFANTRLEAVLIDPDTGFELSSQGIPEPVGGTVTGPGAIDLVLVPTLVFDRAGNRVGYGKGFYDRFLSQCRPDCIKVGLCYFAPVDKIMDRSHFDVPLTACVTPQACYVF